MNPRYLIGAGVEVLKDTVLSSRFFPLNRYVPPGLSWAYDVQRWSGSRQASVIIDAGANLGQTSRYILRYFRPVKVYAFEPVSDTYVKLCRNLAHYSQVRCWQIALSDSEGESVIYLHDDHTCHSLLADPQAETHGEEKIQMETLDGFCQQQSIPFIDVLKMDVQGFEMKVLQGAHKLLKESRIRFVYAEVAFL